MVFNFIKLVYEKYSYLSKQARDSIIIAATLIGATATILTILGISFSTLGIKNIFVGILIVIFLYTFSALVIYFIIGNIFKNSLNITIRNTPISIEPGNIFSSQGMRVIGCDSHFSTIVDDVIISKGSLHGQLVLEHGEKEEIEKAVEKEASRLGLQKNPLGLYYFPLGTIITYYSAIDKSSYLMLAMNELNPQHEAYTYTVQFEIMLMKMWKEIGRVYAGHDVVLPILGSGITRHDDGPKNKDEILRCMLCTLNSSGITLNSKIKIILYDDENKIPLYEYKDIFRSIPRR